ncbi:hypothetical protein NDU88_004126 [Pleurodeles waltl]|uniref:Uncharacterized protein n=1 Tax=Pleurodeles waltl TaxID=8319 RepID=A0AAV7NIY1_PLEWA|nr:hypothetical protein NDU88_004126 [Pleurodeles waltl]
MINIGRHSWNSIQKKRQHEGRGQDGRQSGRLIHLRAWPDYYPVKIGTDGLFSRRAHVSGGLVFHPVAPELCGCCGGEPGPVNGDEPARRRWVGPLVLVCRSLEEEAGCVKRVRGGL